MYHDKRKGDRHKPRTGDRHVTPRTGDRHVHRSPAKKLPIIAVDGEGWGVDEYGRQKYMVMVAANETKLVSALYTGDHIGTHEAFSFIWSLPKAHLTSYFFTYDISMITRDLPQDALEQLWNRDKREVTKRGNPTVVYWNGWGMDWLSGKFFRLYRHEYGSAPGRGESRTIYDAFPFHQKSFLACLDGFKGVCTDDEYAIIKEGKARRSDEIDIPDRDRARIEIKYSTEECKALAKIQKQVYQLCADSGYTLRSYYGAGSVASAMFAVKGINKYRSATQIDERLNAATARAYFGGRFEISGYGNLNRVHSYDIRSAYPYAATTLPCLQHSIVKYRNKMPADLSVEGLYHIKWSASGFWGPYPMRMKRQHPFWPLNGDNYIYQSEALAGLPLTDEIKVTNGWEIIRTCECDPFGWLFDIYEQRKAYKAAGDGREKILKLGPNAIYGKLAQTIGARTYAEPIWAGMITAKTRAMLLEAIVQNPRAIISTATDGILSTEKLDLDLTDRLGCWEADYDIDDILIAQPGVWFSGDNRIIKRRGVPVLDTDTIRRTWSEQHGTVIYPSYGAYDKRFIGIGQGLARNDLTLIGRWAESERRGSFGPGIYKRTVDENETVVDGWRNAYPHPIGLYENRVFLSYPYDKLVEDPLKDILDDNKSGDWVLDDLDEGLMG